MSPLVLKSATTEEINNLFKHLNFTLIDFFTKSVS